MKDKPPYCPKAASVHLAHKTRKGVGAVARLGCKSWACLGCSGRMRLAYGQSLALHFMNSPLPIRETSCTPKAWGKVQRRLNYMGADYVRITGDSGLYHVLHTAKTCDPELTMSEAIARLGELLRSVRHTARGKRFRPVQASRGWKLPERVSDYEFAGLVPYANPDKVRKALEDDGAKVQTVDGEPGSWLLVYHKPERPKSVSGPPGGADC